MADEPNAPVVTDKANEPAPVADTGQANAQEAARLRFKSQQEAEKSYQELERKFGEHSKEVEEARKLRDQTDTLLRAIWADPDLYRQVEQGIQKYAKGEVIPDERKPVPQKEQPKDAIQTDPAISDMKKSQENKILDDFFTRYGYKELGEQEKKDAYAKLSLSLAEIVDPAGNRPIKEVLESIPLSKLPRFLENAHRIANYDMAINQAKQSALGSRENDEAVIGSFSSSASKSRANQVTLTNRERETARKMGISEDDYLKQKAEIQKQNSRYD